MAKAGWDAPTVGGEALANALEACAVELGRIPVEHRDTVFTLRAAVEETGCSIGHPGRLVREGKILMAGRPGGSEIAWKYLPW